MRIAILVLLAAANASASGIGPRHLKIPSLSDGGVGYTTLLSNIALNGTAAVRTWTLTQAQTDGMAKVVLTVKRTRVAGTDLTMTCTQSPDAGTTKGTIQTCEYAAASGTCTHYQTTWKSANSSTETLTWEMSVLGYGQLDCTFASTSAGATDKLTVYGVMVTQ